MPIPDFQSMMLPFLQLHEDGQVHKRSEVVEHLAKVFKLSEEEFNRLLPSGGQTYLRNRAAWAAFNLRKAVLLKRVDKSSTVITERGLEVLRKKPDAMNMKYLMQFPEYKDFKEGLKQRKGKEKTEVENDTDKTPEDLLEEGYQKIREELADEIIEQIKGCSPEFFERLVVELLVAMGYGGSRKDAGEAVGKSGDGGIDGIIKEDKLGLDIIYIQAKRWDNTVGRPEIQKFAGALQGRRARKGIFLTTANFSREALDFVNNIESKIVLIDGEALANMMIDNNIGVSKVARYEVKRIDSDYFIDE
jgi:restriction system protein